MAPDPRVVRAFTAMRELGISPKVVKPVLKNLLKLYNKDWSLIEADNFHTLVEAIYELEDDKKKKDKGKAVIQLDKDRDLEEDIESDSNPRASETEDFVVPVAVDHSGSRRVSSYANISGNLNEDVNDDGLSGSYSTCHGKIFSFTFSPSGDVNISINSNRAPIRPLPHSSDIQSILKSVEDKFLSSNEIVRSQCSVVNLVKELCKSYLRHRDGSAECYPNSNCNSGRYLGTVECNFQGSSGGLNRESGLQLITLGDNNVSYKISDITNGTEKLKIPLLDDLGNEILPEFTYIRQNTVYQNASVHVSLARISDDDCCINCSGNCLLLSVPCACARDTGGEYAYTKDGLLKEEFLATYISMDVEPHKHYLFYCQDCPFERLKSASKLEPCKGHLVRKFIKECWRKCGCSMLCGNRVVQRGITINLQVFLTKEGKGWGLQTLEDLPKGAFVCEFVGEILTNMELHERNKQSEGNKRHTYPVYLDADWGAERVLKDEDALCLDATYYGNVARFINHRITV